MDYWKKIICIYCGKKYDIANNCNGLYSCEYCRKLTPTELIEDNKEREAYKIILKVYGGHKADLSVIRQLHLLFTNKKPLDNITRVTAV